MVCGRIWRYFTVVVMCDAKECSTPSFTHISILNVCPHCCCHKFYYSLSSSLRSVLFAVSIFFTRYFLLHGALYNVIKYLLCKCHNKKACSQNKKTVKQNSIIQPGIPKTPIISEVRRFIPIAENPSSGAAELYISKIPKPYIIRHSTSAAVFRLRKNKTARSTPAAISKMSTKITPVNNMSDFRY